MNHTVNKAKEDESVHLFSRTTGGANATAVDTGRLLFSISISSPRSSSSKSSNQTVFHIPNNETSLEAESDGKQKCYVVRDTTINLSLSFILVSKRRRHAQLVADNNVVADVRRVKSDYMVTDAVTGSTAATVTTNGKGVQQHRVVDVLHSALQCGLNRAGVSEEGVTESGVRSARWRMMLVTLVTLLADDMFDG